MMQPDLHSKIRLQALAIGCIVALALLALAALWSLSDSAAKVPGRVISSTPSVRDLPALPSEVAQHKQSDLSAGDALSRNAAVPFAAGAVEPATAFKFTGSGEDRKRAVDCLALAAMAEAGGSEPGQRAVMQVVLNRVRHPAFAKTVCGVVFEGAERATGCQFTFTCDGSLGRRYSDAAWSSARRRASEALGGYVFAKVGTATHYHTDWVYPYWSPSLDKVAKVGTHLFFRWKGYWGTLASFRTPYRGGERSLAELTAGRKPVEQAAVDDVSAPPGNSLTVETAAGARVIKHPDGGAFLVSYASRPGSGQALAMARRLCGGNGYCKVMGWIDASAMPRGFPIPPRSREKLTFSYVLDDQNRETVLYDCKVFAGAARSDCIPAPLQSPA